MQASLADEAWRDEILEPFGSSGLEVTIRNGKRFTPLRKVNLSRFAIKGRLENTEILNGGNESRRLHFKIGREEWELAVHQVTPSLENPEELRFSLSNREARHIQTRLCNRWKSGDLFKVHGELTNNLEFDQKTPYVLHDISVGGLSFDIGIEVPLFVGQQTKIAISFPYIGKHESTVQIKSIQKLGNLQRVSASFETLSNELLDGMRQYLIGFRRPAEWGNLELELQSSNWPKEAIEYKTKQSDSNNVTFTQGVESNVISKIQLKTENAETAWISNIELSNLWEPSVQLSHIVPRVVGFCLSAGIENVRSKNTQHDLTEFGFRERASIQTLPLQDNEMSVAQRYQLHRTMAAYPEQTILQDTLIRRARRIALDSLRLLRSKHSSDKAPLSWDKYGTHYDNMCEKNPSYQELLNEYDSWIQNHPELAGDILDLGAGTGNFSMRTARAHPSANILHVDQDVIMNRSAQRKYSSSGYQNIEIKTCDAKQLNIKNQSLTLVTAIHSLYTMDHPETVLKKVYDWLAPGGYLYTIDIGRTINVSEWTRHLFYLNVKKQGITQSISYLWRNREIVRQNQRIQDSQRSGKFWNKTADEFGTSLKKLGFEIQQQEVRYRGVSDLFVCQKPL